MGEVINFKAEVWEYNGKGSWHFITLPVELAEVVRASTVTRRGFGSVKVLAVLGKSKWLTSIFPDTKRNSYLLPIKKDVRKANNLKVGSITEVKLSIIDT